MAVERKSLTRLFELRSEVQVFLSEYKVEFSHWFSDELWLARLAFLAADIFGRLNDLNSSLQRQNITHFTISDKIKAAITKLEFIIKDIRKNEFAALLTLEDFTAQNELTINKILINP